MNRVAVVGAGGQLGTDLVEVLNAGGDYQVFPLGHGEIECTDPASVQKALRETRPDVVVNCAAFVRVDECEDRPEEAFQVNAIGAFHVARAATEVGARGVYVSTDYVFDGEKRSPYVEEDWPRPINVYGASKLAGECLVQQACPQGLVVRMASLFGRAGSRGKGGNFIESILRKAKSGEALRVVDDVRMSPTYARDAAVAVEMLLRQNARGLFHFANAGSCTWYEFARKTLDLVGLPNELERISSRDYPAKARRPNDSSLVSTKLGPFLEGGPRSWQEALKAYLVEKQYL